MSIGNWLTLGMFTVAQITALIVAYINLRLKIKELEMQIDQIKETAKNNQQSFHIHEQQNEKMFDKYEKKLDDVFDIVNDVKNILINKNFN